MAGPVCKQQVVGSSPIVSTNQPTKDDQHHAPSRRAAPTPGVPLVQRGAEAKGPTMSDGSGALGDVASLRAQGARRGGTSRGRTDRRLAALLAEQIAEVARLVGEKIAEVAALEDEPTAKVAALRADEIARVTALKDEAIARVTALKDDAIAQVTALREEPTAQVTALKAEEIAQVTGLRDAEIAQVAALRGQRDRPGGALVDTEIAEVARLAGTVSPPSAPPAASPAEDDAIGNATGRNQARSPPSSAGPLGHPDPATIPGRRSMRRRTTPPAPAPDSSFTPDRDPSDRVQQAIDDAMDDADHHPEDSGRPRSQHDHDPGATLDAPAHAPVVPVRDPHSPPDHETPDSAQQTIDEAMDEADHHWGLLDRSTRASPRARRAAGR